MATPVSRPRHREIEPDHSALYPSLRRCEIKKAILQAKITGILSGVLGASCFTLGVIHCVLDKDLTKGVTLIIVGIALIAFGDKQFKIATRHPKNSLSYKVSAKIRIPFPENHTLVIPANFSPRYSEKSHTYFERSPTDVSVKKHVRKFMYLDALLEGASAAGAGVSPTYPLNLLQSLTKELYIIALTELKIFEPRAREISSFIAAETLNLLESASTCEELRRALHEEIIAKNEHKEEIDKETFKALIGGNQQSPADLLNACNFVEIQTEYTNGTWKDDEEREVSFNRFPADLVDKLEELLTKFEPCLPRIMSLKDSV